MPCHQPGSSTRHTFGRPGVVIVLILEGGRHPPELLLGVGGKLVAAETSERCGRAEICSQVGSIPADPIGPAKARRDAVVRAIRIRTSVEVPVAHWGGEGLLEERFSSFDTPDVPLPVLVKLGVAGDIGGACNYWPSPALPKSSGKNVTPVWPVGIPTAVSRSNSGLGWVFAQ